MSSPISPRRLSPRQRRLRVALWALSTGLVVGGVLALYTWRSGQTEGYRPGEDLEGITGNLERELPQGAPHPDFVDVTESSGLAGFETFAGERTSQLPEDMGSGAAWGDYDGDGDDDLFAVAAGGRLGLAARDRAPSRLYENRGDGTFRQVHSFPRTQILGMGAAWGDYDGDGRLDLVVSGYRALRLFRNGPDGFERVESFPEPDGFWTGVSWADYDRDGDVDLYVCGYVQYREAADGGGRTSRQFGAVVPFTLNPASYEPLENLLFRNDGEGRFVEVGAKLGVSNPGGRSLSALWHDLDGDGRLDLYVANDVSDNALFLGGDTGFEDVSHGAWVADYRGAMGLAAGDWNRDGDDDLFVSHWIAQENALYDSLLVDLMPGTSDASGGDVPSLSFADQSSLAGLGQPSLHRVGWGAEFADLDGDGWLDLVIANGSTFETNTDPKQLVPQAPFLFWNRGDFFYDLAPFLAELAEPRVARGLAVSDFDLDGDVDLLFVHLDGGLRLLRNEMQTGHWLELRLRSRPAGNGLAPGFAEGATVLVRLGDVVLRRSVTGASYLSQSTRTLHFGLGDSAQVDGLDVQWLGGERQRFEGVTADAVWELRQGESAPRRVGALPPMSERERVAAFWEAHRAAMQAMKREGDLPRATELFERALLLDPEHEDARYYLASSLAAQDRGEGALMHLDRLRQANPQSYRAWAQWGTLRARTARTRDDLDAAEASLQRAQALNPEQTGVLLLLGEVALMRGDDSAARQRLEWACRTNERAAAGFFLQAFLASKAGQRQRADELLTRAREVRGAGWKPEGATAEGDTVHGGLDEVSPLSRFWRNWNGVGGAPQAFAALTTFLVNPFYTGGNERQSGLTDSP